MASSGSIMIVDDSFEFRQLLVDLLSAHGYQVHPADTGELALAFAATVAPDLVLLDVRMPGIDGFEVCRRMKADPRTEKVPVLFISGVSEAEDHARGFEVGGVDFITKPFEEAALLARIATHLELSGFRHGLERLVAERTLELERTNRRLQEEVSERARAEVRLKDAIDLNEQILDASPLGIATYRADTGQCVMANPALGTLVGAPLEQLLAQNFRELGSWKMSGLLDAAERCLATQTMVQETMQIRTTFGKNIWTMVTFAPLHSDGFPHLLVILKDATERVLAERTLRKAHEVLEEVGEMARVGAWDIDLQDNTLHWSPMVHLLHEVEPGFLPDVETAIKFYTPEAVPVITEAVQRCIQEGLSFDLELPLLSAKGNRIWVRAMGKPQYEGSKIVQIGGVFQDVTARRAAEARIRQLAHAVTESPTSILITDAQGSIEYANPAFLRLTGYSLEEALGQNPRILKSGEQGPDFYRDLWDTITAGRDWYGDFHNKKKNGELYWESEVISPLKDDAGAVTHFIAVKQDITDRKHLEVEREAMIADLQEALDHVKILSGLLPICSSCKKIRDEAGYWNQVEHYLASHGDLKFTHGICPDCANIYFPKQNHPE